MLMYGDGRFGILEANYVLAAVTFVSGILGPQVWDYPIKNMVASCPFPDLRKLSGWVLVVLLQCIFVVLNPLLYPRFMRPI